MQIPTNWTFESDVVAAGFDRHVREQLPWYDLATGALAHVARHYIGDGGLVYDLGASTGNVGRALAGTLDDRRAHLIAIEAAPQMVERYDAPGGIVLGDATAYHYEPFDLAVLFLVLMFVPVPERAGLLDRLLDVARPGAALIVFDKLDPPGGYPGTVLRRLTLAGKVATGTPAEEIVAKELSLGGVQRPVDVALFTSRPGGRVTEFFRFGEFVGWLVEKV